MATAPVWKTLCISTATIRTEDTETDFSRSVDVWIESAAASICCQAFHHWRLRGIFRADFHLEFEEAKLVRCVGRANNKAAQITDIFLEMCDGKC